MKGMFQEYNLPFSLGSLDDISLLEVLGLPQNSTSGLCEAWTCLESTCWSIVTPGDRAVFYQSSKCAQTVNNCEPWIRWNDGVSLGL